MNLPIPQPLTDVPAVTSALDEGARSYGFLKKSAELTVFIVFILYSIGYLIWRTYLGSFGISPIPFFQTEYFAAAFCYLVILITFGLPAFLLYEVYMLPDTRKRATTPIAVVAMLWALLISRTTGLFLSFGTMFTIKSVFAVIVIVMGVHLVVIIVLASIKAEWKERKFFQIVGNVNFLAVYIFLLGVWTAFSDSKLNKEFLLNTLFLYTVVGYINGQHIKKMWFQSDVGIKVMICAVVSLGLVQNIREFGISQFGVIPKSLGGGEAEKALVRFSHPNEELPTILAGC